MSDKKFPSGGALTLDGWIEHMDKKHQIEIPEEERQTILLALAELSIARPGWVNMLSRIAQRMDNTNEQGQPEMFEQFRRNHSNPVYAVMAADSANQKTS